jgi:hypothetical protein
MRRRPSINAIKLFSVNYVGISNIRGSDIPSSTSAPDQVKIVAWKRQLVGLEVELDPLHDLSKDSQNGYSTNAATILITGNTTGA